MIDSYSHFCPEYKAVIDYAITQGYALPSTKQLWLQNHLMRKLVDAASNGLASYDLIRCYANDAADGANCQFSGINWAAPGNNAPVPTNSPTKVSNQGYHSDGTTSYINENFTPSTEVASASDAFYAVYLIGNSSSIGRVGAANGSNVTYMTPRDSGASDALRGLLAGTGMGTTAQSTSEGLSEVSRVNTTTKQTSKNGVQVDSSSITLTTLANVTLYSLCYNSSGTPQRFMANTIKQAFTFMGVKSNVNTLTVYNALAEYLGAL